MAAFVGAFFALACYASDGVGIGVWQGGYEYQSSFFDGTQSVITDIKLTIRSDGSCSLLWEGFQKDEGIVCKVDKPKEKVRGINVEFLSYPDGKIENMYGVEVYSPGERLFSLLKKSDGTLITVWSEKYRPPQSHESGIFFEKSH